LFGIWKKANQIKRRLFIFKNSPVLIIGHHVVYGKIVTLEKPIVVLKRMRKADQMEIEWENGTNGSAIQTQYIVQSIVRKKILFNKRPRPIVVSDLKRI
jgi:chromosome transmission fidelity protein 8